MHKPSKSLKVCAHGMLKIFYFLSRMGGGGHCQSSANFVRSHIQWWTLSILIAE